MSGSGSNGTGGSLVARHGELRIHLGAAAGVGTTYAMLDEALRRAGRGADLVVGCVDTHHRTGTRDKLAEVLAAVGSDAAPDQLDVPALLRRAPAVVLVDELAHRNAEGSPNEHRWQDVDELLRAGIDVVTTLNVQQIESLADQVHQIVGAVPDAQVPDEFLGRADQIELVDITPEAIRRRIAHGNVYEPDELDPASAELFNGPAFAELRALLLFWMADRLTAGPHDPRGARERVVVAVTDGPGSDAVLRRAARLAQRSRARLVAVHVRPPDAAPPSPTLVERRALVRDLGGSYHELTGADVAASLVAFADAEGATQLVLGTSGRSRLTRLRSGSIIDQVIRRAGRVDVHVISHGPTSPVPNRPAGDGTAAELHRPPWRLLGDPNTARRQVVGALFAVVVFAALTAALVATRDRLSVSTSLALYLLAVVSVTSLAGRLAGVLGAAASPFLANWFLIPPYHTLRVSELENLLELVVFVSVAIIVSGFVSVAARRADEAAKARREATTLATLAGSGGPEPLQSITDHLRRSFDLDGVAIVETDAGLQRAVTGTVVASSGEVLPPDLRDVDLLESLGPGVVLAARGRALTADDHRVLRAFVQQLGRALEQDRLAVVAAEADALSRADELRTAILRAVSHDLRTPLATIKASVSSLRQRDVEWPIDVRDEFLASIEDETDRLTSIVSNLLDLSRLQAGVLRPVLRPASLEEVVPAAIQSLGQRAAGVEIDLPSDLVDVAVDPALLERVVANLVANAIAWSPPGSAVRVLAHARDRSVQVHVVDHGPGIRPKDRAVVLQPFHRLDDTGNPSGIGLGLAIADGLTRAMGGHLELRDTPRGGLTAVVVVPVASTPRRTELPKVAVP
jgi:two-component system sensor histidine kinase KdpD